MRHLPLESAFLATLVIMTGCGQGTSPEFVDFKQTAPSELDREQNQKTDSASAATTEVAAVSNTKETTTDNAGSKTDATGSAVPAAVAAETANGGTATTVAGQQPTGDAGSTVATNTPSENATAAGDSRGEKMVTSRQSGLTGPADAPGVDNAAEGEHREIQLLIPEKHFRKELGQAFRVTYDDLDLLKVLNMEPVPADAVSHFPDWLSELDGKPVRIRGFMYPTFAATDLTEFVLARDNGICCFVRKPKVYDIIGVTLADGEKTDYIEGRPFDVQGILRIDPAADDNNLSRLYRIEQAKVIH
ncbi:MAG: DUF3299 domain-containing protein [Planctomycetaceae bacterium]|nr:DUF3299 domain-containing protein [Planctomycetaceae bacterium]